MSFTRKLSLLLVAGAAVHGLAAYARGRSFYATFDTQSMVAFVRALRHQPLTAYRVDRSGIPAWPYPPMFLSWLAAARSIAHGTGPWLGFLIRVPAMAADIAIAWLVQASLGRRGAGERTRLTAAALIALGPVFVATSSIEGQIDALAFLPVVLSMYLWDRLPANRAPVITGLLIGLGAATKTVPIVMVLAFLPLLSDSASRIKLLVSAVAVPLLGLAPFELAFHGTFHAIASYQGFPGWGGSSMLVQPGLLRGLIKGVEPSWSPLQDHLQVALKVVLPAALTFTAAVLLRQQRSPAAAGSLVVLTLYVFSPNYFPQYAVWGLPIVMMAGQLKGAAAMQAVLSISLLIEARVPWRAEAPFWLYLVTMTAVWLAASVAWFKLVRGEPADAVVRPRSLRVEPPVRTPAPSAAALLARGEPR